MNQRTAILLFSRSAEAEAVEKNFGGTDTANWRVARALIERTKRTVGRAGLPVFHLDERAQSGDTFGDRLSGAVTDIFSRGFQQLIVVGNDTPGLRVRQLERAAEELTNDRSVLGLDRRGGVWLIGLKRANFDAREFTALPWQTSALACSLHECLGEVCLLGKLSDINSVTELQQQWRLFKTLLSGLSNLFRPCVRAEVDLRFMRSSANPRCLRGRAPPVVS